MKILDFRLDYDKLELIIIPEMVLDFFPASQAFLNLEKLI